MRRCLGCMREYSENYDICPYCGYVYGTAAASKNHLPPGIILQNRYLLGRVLGQGGFGITYIAWDQRLEKPVAVKEFFPTAFASRMTGETEVSCFNVESRQYFDSGLQKMMNESRTLARFTDQTNIVQVLDCIEENGTAYIIMELLRGETVQSILTRERMLSLDYTMQIILPILLALETIHQTGLVHRDISPDNIFVCEDGKVKLLDFGAARVATGQDNKTLSVMLKKGFAPIEQYSSHGNQGAFTDVYAVCATMYKMLTGVTPENSLDRMARDTLRPLTDFANVPVPVAKVIQRGMAVEASDRIQTAGELYDRLQNALQQVERSAAKERRKQKEPRPRPVPQPPVPQYVPQSVQPSAPELGQEVTVPLRGDQIPVIHNGTEPQKSGLSALFKNKRNTVIAAVALVLVAAIVVGIGVFGSGSNEETTTAASIAAEDEPQTKAETTTQPTTQPQSPFIGLKKGNMVTFGSYEQDGNTSNGKEPVEWIVAETASNGDLLLVSRYALDCRAYHPDEVDVTWETCELRKWMNGTFYNACFSAEDKTWIRSANQENPGNTTYKVSGGNNTTDNVWLLSLPQIQSLGSAYMKVRPTAYAVQQGAFLNEDNGNTWWSLRTPGAGSTLNMIVRTDGGIPERGEMVMAEGAIRPAIWVTAS